MKFSGRKIDNVTNPFVFWEPGTVMYKAGAGGVGLPPSSEHHTPGHQG